MLHTVAELLDALRERELARLREVGDVGHAGMIGDMYEGLSRALLAQMLPVVLDLRVVEGKVRNDDGTLSGQMDVMIVRGEGEQLPHTTHFIYPESRVVAVFEIKKTLTGSDLRDAIEVLKTVGRPGDDVPIPRSVARGAFHAVLGMELPRSAEETDRLPPYKAMVSYALALDAVKPIRVVLGYEGFRTERGVREALLRYLEENSPAPGSRPTRGFGPPDLPNLILCDRLALVKLNGMPYAAHVAEPETWACLGSAHEKSGVLLLEILWTRLRSIHPEVAEVILGDDLTIETTYPLLLARVGTVSVEGQDHRGWAYEVVDSTESVLRRWNSNAEWAPSPITPEIQATIFMMAKRNGVLDLTDPDLRAALEPSGGLDNHLEQLRATGLFWVDEGRWLRSLADDIVTVFLPDGRMAAANQSDPRFRGWVENQRGPSS